MQSLGQQPWTLVPSASNDPSAISFDLGATLPGAASTPRAYLVLLALCTILPSAPLLVLPSTPLA